MNKTIYFLAVSILFLWAGCKQAKPSADLIIDAEIDIKKNDDIKNQSELIDTCFFINLETNENHLVGKIDKILVKDKRIYLLDKEQAMSVFIFSISGKFVGKIDRRGKGPGEYSELSDFDVDSVNQQIVINDGFLKKLIYYDYNGKYIKEISLKFPTCQFKLTDKQIIFIGSGYGHNLVFSDLKGKVAQKYFPYNEILAIELPNHLTNYAGEILYQQTGNDTIYTIQNSKVIPSRLFKINDEVRSFKMYGLEIPKQITRYNETGEFVTFAYTYESTVKYVVFSKKSKKYLIYSNQTKDEFISYPYAPQFYSNYNGYFVSVIQPHLLNKMNSKYLLDNKLTPSSNPVIGFYKFKVF